MLAAVPRRRQERDGHRGGPQGAGHTSAVFNLGFVAVATTSQPSIQCIAVKGTAKLSPHARQGTLAVRSAERARDCDDGRSQQVGLFLIPDP